MITKIQLPSGHLGLYSSVDIDTELSGLHHKTLLTTNANMWERAVASVIGDLLQSDYSVYKISLPDLIYLFFVVRCQTLGNIIQSDWACQRIVQNGNISGMCNHQNPISLDFSTFKIVEVKKGFKYPIRKLKSGNEEIECYTKLLTVEEEFECIDLFLQGDEGLELNPHARDEIREGGTYEYLRIRLNKSLYFSDPKYTALGFKEKENLLDGNGNYSTITDLLTDLGYLSSLGTDLSPRTFKCGKCGGVARVALPFRGDFLLSSRK
jgi:hypothetical protein